MTCLLGLKFDAVDKMFGFSLRRYSIEMFAFNITYLYIFLTFSVIYEWALIMTCLLGLELGALEFDAACQLYHAVSGQLFKVAWLTSLSPLNTLGLKRFTSLLQVKVDRKEVTKSYKITS